ncbi:hypothetical protein C6P45_001399 [Maudiozyma exigua]|uniref:Karyogamy protein n=1 Tax=Maudiozyma exigua TaxID=34358 RepID=A0A9P6W0J8_MAUEX|nr:hypothetical protein C6P45_001399 [Kazachstania exigua]
MIGEEKAKLDSAVVRISGLLTRLADTEQINDIFYNDITQFYDELYGLNKLLAMYLKLDNENFLNEMANVASLRDIFSDILVQFESIEPILCDIVDLIDKDDTMIATKAVEMDTTTIAQLLKECNEVTKNNKLVMKSIREIIGTYLDFEEILENHIGTIDDIVNESLNQLFEIHEERNGSPIRHYPLFTLDKIVGLLTRDTPDERMLSKSGRRIHSNQPQIEEEPKFPTFSVTDVKISKKFIQLQKTLNPIEKSLIEILPHRIEAFQSRPFTYTDDLAVLLNEKYDVVMINYRYLTREVRALKLELVDNRWNFIFGILNTELSDRIQSVQKNYNDLKSHTFLEKIQERQKKKLEKDTHIISKTFNTIYKALEFSLLSTDIASGINDLAEKWIHLREITDEYLDSVPSLADNEALMFINERSRANQNRIAEVDLDFLKPPRISRFDSRDETTTDEEPDVANLTIESIANNLRQFSLGSNTKKSDNTDNTLVSGQTTIKKMTKPLIIPSITSTTSGTTISTEITEELLAMKDNVDYPLFESRVLNLGTKHGGDRFPSLAGYKESITEKLEPAQAFKGTPLMYPMDDNNSDYESDLESSRLDGAILNGKKTVPRNFHFPHPTKPHVVSISDNHIPYDTEEVRKMETSKLRYYSRCCSLIPRVKMPTNIIDSGKIRPPPQSSKIAMLPNLDGNIVIPTGMGRYQTMKTSVRRKLRQPTLMSQLLTPPSRR